MRRPDEVRRKGERTECSGFPRSQRLPSSAPMPKPKGKAGPSKGYNKQFKRRPTARATHDYIPESAIDREPDVEEPEDEDSANSRVKVDVPIAMWVRETLHTKFLPLY